MIVSRIGKKPNYLKFTVTGAGLYVPSVGTKWIELEMIGAGGGETWQLK